MNCLAKWVAIFFLSEKLLFEKVICWFVAVKASFPESRLIVLHILMGRRLTEHDAIASMARLSSISTTEKQLLKIYPLMIRLPRNSKIGRPNLFGATFITPVGSISKLAFFVPNSGEKNAKKKSKS